MGVVCCKGRGWLFGGGALEELVGVLESIGLRPWHYALFRPHEPPLRLKSKQMSRW